MYWNWRRIFLIQKSKNIQIYSNKEVGIEWYWNVKIFILESVSFQILTFQCHSMRTSLPGSSTTCMQRVDFATQCELDYFCAQGDAFGTALNVCKHKPCLMKTYASIRVLKTSFEALTNVSYRSVVENWKSFVYLFVNSVEGVE